ncbi:hypothetical protein CPAV1605_634 [seawater metagenome]|uniref:Uncharacterized protein n=1 Tax=seawater metagenome TaxID=1561972 RepID=A0A5E8CJU7_9ZZZZ
MSKTTTSMRSYYGSLARKISWNKLADSLKIANFPERFGTEMTLENKKRCINEFQATYKGSLKKNGLDGNQIKKSISYQLVTELCSAPDKMINKKSYPQRWDNLYMHALTKATNCNK